ncbi:uncharacterized protein MONBRDRAFT_21913 [Monosiga brevicollis MX1]|uniref:GDP/GTP exchange factor Sec2 N-terminal domain-containing protein n=1 Tax=Monosiga brevicollis TaxID=81824 RepID=A9UNZ6_MONBE|nr:uncharacterized protein MONBRDRAFT_21913 [Monosiga brevicollis MX1]EDQ92786.1 predicted protein [Monosiga brevicollis MX1]|eukprot:XP_001742548.1 hypothetical protein [Monosiga brevicollis MX1]
MDNFVEPQVDVAGITALTLVNTKRPLGHRRNVSWANTELPRIMYEDTGHISEAPSTASIEQAPGAGSPDNGQSKRVSLTAPMVDPRPRSNSDSMASQRDRGNYDHTKTLAYWRLEKELRLAKDKLLDKVEQCESHEQYREQLTKEMDDLTTSVFEEAHEMVRVEKEARFLADKRSHELSARNEILTAEVAALKAIVEHTMLTKPDAFTGCPTSTPSSPSKSSSKRSFRWRRSDESRLRTRSNGADDLPPSQEPRPPSGLGFGTSTSSQVDPQVDSQTLAEFTAWRSDGAPTEHKWLLDVEAYDVQPCLARVAAADLQSTILDSIRGNGIVIEEVPGGTPEVTRCELSDLEAVCKFRVRLGDKDWRHIAHCTRDRLVALCNFYTYVRYCQQVCVSQSEHP